MNEPFPSSNLTSETDKKDSPEKIANFLYHTLLASSTAPLPLTIQHDIASNRPKPMQESFYMDHIVSALARLNQRYNIPIQLSETNTIQIPFNFKLKQFPAKSLFQVFEEILLAVRKESETDNKELNNAYQKLYSYENQSKILTLLAQENGLNPNVIRKDLSYKCGFSTPSPKGK